MRSDTMNILALSDFYKSMRFLKETRQSIMSTVKEEESINTKDLKALEEIKQKLEGIPKKGKFFELKTEQNEVITLELDYELSELKKDEIFLKYGHDALEEYLAKIHKNYNQDIQEGLDFLKPYNFKHFVTDRDGTISNYCGRYQSSIQPVYNAICLSKFREVIEGKAIILTSAPLFEIGLADVSIQPKDEYILAGSKGREMLMDNKKYTYPIPDEQQEKLDILNHAIEELLLSKKYASFKFIGSGLQYKFGQTTLARQDKNNSISEEKSLQLKTEIESLLQELDPEKSFFSLEDTGKDLEIMLNVNSHAEKLEEFDKGHGLNFIVKHLGEALKNETVLVCGDTHSDIPLITSAQDLGANVISIFVTDDEGLKRNVRAVCKSSFFVSSPDVLVYMLFKYSKNRS
jgi:predicted RNA-binding protein